MTKTIKNIYISLTVLLFSTGCKESGIEGCIINNSDDTLIIQRLAVHDTLLLLKSTIFISLHIMQEWVSHKSTCCTCELVASDGFIKPLNKARKLTKHIHNENEWKKIPAGKNSSLNCQLIIYQHDIIN